MYSYQCLVSWYDPKEVLPTKDCKCLVVHNGTGWTAFYDSDDRMFSFGNYTVDWDGVDYWTLLPNAPKEVI